MLNIFLTNVINFKSLSKSDNLLKPTLIFHIFLLYLHKIYAPQIRTTHQQILFEVLPLYHLGVCLVECLEDVREDLCAQIQAKIQEFAGLAFQEVADASYGLFLVDFLDRMAEFYKISSQKLSLLIDQIIQTDLFLKQQIASSNISDLSMPSSPLILDKRIMFSLHNRYTQRSLQLYQIATDDSANDYHLRLESFGLMVEILDEKSGAWY